VAIKKQAAAVMAVLAAVLLTTGRAEATNSWTVESTPDASTYVNNLFGVSCPTSTYCMAVGSDLSSTKPIGYTLAEQWTAGVWSIIPTPSTPGDQSELVSVSCRSAKFCMAVGDEHPHGPGVILAERWNGSVWTATDITGPMESGLTAVSCPTASTCTAVGDSLGTDASLIYRWNGSTWTAQTAVTLPDYEENQLYGVSCPTTSACVAVGSYFGPSSTFVLVERWNGSSWTLQTIPHPAGVKSSQFQSVSCVSAAVCTAVGSSVTGANVTIPRAERSNGNTWALQPTPTPTSSPYNLNLAGVSCPTSKDCTAVGSYSTNSSNNFAYAELWNGTAWVLQSVPTPSGDMGALLYQSSCSAPTACTGVGTVSTTSSQIVLAERYS